jgi:NTE family protein
MDGAQDKHSSHTIGSLAKSLPGQVVLVLEGGGALGSYQAGVYQALHDAGIEPDWIIGTSIGAINASLIAGNAPQDRLARLKEFWKRMEQNPVWLFPRIAWLRGAVGPLVDDHAGHRRIFPAEPTRSCRRWFPAGR